MIDWAQVVGSFAAIVLIVSTAVVVAVVVGYIIIGAFDGD